MSGNSTLSDPRGGGAAAFLSDPTMHKFERATEAYQVVAAGGVTAKQCVVFSGTAGQVTRSATGSVLGTQIGIALNSGVPGDVVDVCVRGVVSGVPATGVIADGGPVSRSSTTPGAVMAAAAATAGEVIGFAIGAAAGGLVTIRVNR